MTLWAEWDPETKSVIRIDNDAPSAGGTRSGDTGAPRSASGVTRRYPFEVQFPETYVPRFPHLLGHSRMFLEDGVVYQRFPDADFSEAAVRGALTAEVKLTARSALDDTDWYFMRELDTREPVPDDVRPSRQAIRDACDAKVTAIADASPGELLDFDTGLIVDGKAWRAAPPMLPAPTP
jgi:hypothetical protein